MPPLPLAQKAGLTRKLALSTPWEGCDGREEGRGNEIANEIHDEFPIVRAR